MIVADTNVWIAYWTGQSADYIAALDSALSTKSARMLPMVLAELISDPALAPAQRDAIVDLPLLSLLPGFWVRAGILRASLFARQMHPQLIDSLIAQMCIDYDAPLLTRDAGFSRFTDAGLKIHK
jgi:predicted nucleic acid-binding protein